VNALERWAELAEAENRAMRANCDGVRFGIAPKIAPMPPRPVGERNIDIVLDALRAGPMTAGEVRRKLGLTNNQWDSARRILAAAGKIEWAGNRGCGTVWRAVQREGVQ
jgi:hypothetical protein